MAKAVCLECKALFDLSAPQRGIGLFNNNGQACIHCVIRFDGRPNPNDRFECSFCSVTCANNHEQKHQEFFKERACFLCGHVPGTKEAYAEHFFRDHNIRNVIPSLSRQEKMGALKVPNALETGEEKRESDTSPKNLWDEQKKKVVGRSLCQFLGCHHLRCVHWMWANRQIVS